MNVISVQSPLLKACRKFIQTRGNPFSSGSTTATTEQTGILARFLLMYQAPQPSEVAGKEQAAEFVEKAQPLLSLVETLVRCGGVPVRDVAGLEEICEAAKEFLNCLAPTPLHVAVKSKEKLDEQVRRFLEQRAVDRTALVASLKGALVKAGADAAQIAQLLPYLDGKLGGRLCLLSSDEIERVAANGEADFGAASYLTGNPCEVWPGVSARAEAIRGKAVAVVRKQWPMGAGGCEAEDAVGHALLLLNEHWDTPQRGYLFLSALDTWLISTAMNFLRGRAKKVEDQPGPGRTAGPTFLQRTEEFERFLGEMREMYVLVESFFRAGSLPQVKEVWKEFLLKVWENEPLYWEGVEAMADRRGKSNSSTVYVTKRRLLQKLMALRLGRMGGHGGKLMNDNGVIAQIRERHGKVEENALPTVRHLAGLGRASRREKTLAWVYLSRMLADGQANPDEALRMSRDMLEEAVKSLIIPRKDVDEARLERTTEQHAADERGRMKKVREAARSVEPPLKFFVSPLWHLMRQRGFTPCEAVSGLQPLDVDEQKVIADMIEALQKENPE